MAGTGNESDSWSDSRSVSEKSHNGSRSSSKDRDVSELQLPGRTASFGSRFTGDKERNDSSATLPNHGQLPYESQPPHSTLHRNKIESLSSLTPNATQQEQPSNLEGTWPKEPAAWLCLLGGFLLMFNSWGIVNTYGTYASYYTQTLFDGSDILLMNLIGSTQSFLVLLFSAPVGRLTDAGYSKHLIITGTVLVSLGSFLLGSANGRAEPRQGNYGLTWLTQGFIVGLGMACFFVTSSQGWCDQT